MLWTAEIVILYDIWVLKSESEALLNNYFVKKKKKTLLETVYINDRPEVWIMFHYIAGSATNPPIGNPYGQDGRACLLWSCKRKPLRETDQQS